MTISTQDMAASEEKKNEQLGKKAFKSGVWYTVSTIAVKAITVLTTPLITRMMSATDYGVASTFTSWYSLLYVLCALDLTMSIGRAKIDYPNKLNEFIGSLQLLSAMVTFGMILFGILFHSPVSKFMEMNSLLLFMMAIYLLLAPAVNFAQTRYRYEYKYKENIRITLFVSLGSTAFTLLLVWLLRKDKYIGRVIGTILPTCMLSLYFWYISLKKKEIKINIEYWKYALTISLPMLVHTISLNLLATSDRVLISKICGTEATGIYTLAYQYAILINIVMQSVSQAWLPWFHDNYYAGNFKLIKEKSKNLAMFGGFIGIGCISVAPEAIKILGPSSYYSGVYVVAPVAIGIVCQFIYSNYINIELHLKNTKYASIGTVIAAALNIVLNLIFIPVYGFIAAAYTTLFSYIVLMVLHFVITRFILHVKLYQDVFFIEVLLAVCIAAGMFCLLYDYFIIRLVIIGVIGVLFLMLNKEIMRGFLKVKKEKSKEKIKR